MSTSTTAEPEIVHQPSSLVWLVRATEADQERTPRTVATDIMPWLTIQVTRHYRHPGLWVAQAPPILETYVLRSTELEDAKAEAIELVHADIEIALIHIDR